MSTSRSAPTKKKLLDHPEETRRLWRAFESRSFESGVAADELAVEDVFELLDHAAYFQMLGLPTPDSRDQVLEAFAADALLSVNELDEWNITNLGAALFARDLREFSGISRKAMRVIVYEGSTRQKTVREQVGSIGYASGFARLVAYVNNLLPANEQVGEALRRDVRRLPRAGHPRAAGKRPDPPRLHHQRRRADGRDLRRPPRSHQPRTASAAKSSSTNSPHHRSRSSTRI